MSRSMDKIAGEDDASVTSNKKGNKFAKPVIQKIKRTLQEVIECYKDHVDKTSGFPVKYTTKFNETTDKYYKMTDKAILKFRHVCRAEVNFRLENVVAEKNKIINKFDLFETKKISRFLRRRRLFRRTVRTQVAQLQKTLKRVKAVRNAKRLKNLPTPNIIWFKETAQKLENEMKRLSRKWKEMQLVSRMTYINMELKACLYPERQLWMINEHDDF